ncbi:hypothetical protein H9P43_010157 [Blastocladiella emersonii ATCC 22665]|nr:hypothetical protein H9P43_010157 [Blastocladiella emersonii ATCC 22665]
MQRFSIAPRAALHTSRRLLAESASAPAEAAAQGTGRKGRRSTVDTWLAGPGKIFETAQPGMANFVSRRSEQPFPMNPLFRPAPPLSDQIREDIFKSYNADPSKSTISSIAVRFRLSEQRIRAVLKLKAHEKELVGKGGVLQSDFRVGMERLLRHQRAPPLVDVSFIKPIRADPPYLLALDEDAVFGKEDALHLLKGKNAAHEGTRAPKPAKAAVAEPLIRETKRGRFVFNLSASVPQGHVKRIYKQVLKTY